MKRRFGVAFGIAVSSIAIGGLVVCAQESRGQAWHMPLTPWGHPDFQGVWTTDAEIGVPVERPVQYGEKALLTPQEFEEKLQKQAGANGENRRAGAERSVADRTSPDLPQWYGEVGKSSRRTSLVVDPPNGRIPEYTAEARQRVVPKGTALGFVGGSFLSDGPFDGPEDLNLFDRCITRGLPTTWYPSQYSNEFQIVQSQDHVALLYERLHEARIIPLDGRPHLDPAARWWLGDSRGRWEGQTLVVDVTNFNDQKTFMKSGRTLHLIERYTRVDPETLTVSVTVDDPTTWVKPWTFMVTGKTGPAYWQILEGACHEGNYAMRHILSGARVKEQADAAADRFPATGGDIEITPIIHSSVQIEHAGKVVQVDPWSRGDLSRAKPADLILITDDVGHHLDVKAIQQLRKPGAPVIVAANGKAQVPDGIVLANGQSTIAAGVPVEATAAYDIKPGAPEHPKGEANGYVITLGGKRIFFAGVTECVPEVKALKNIDVAFMPMNIPLERMTPVAAAECTKSLRPKVVYVYHYDQDFTARLTNPGAKPQGLPGGITVAQSLTAFRDAMKGEPTAVRAGDWYPQAAVAR